MKKKLILISAAILFFTLVILLVFEFKQKETANVNQVNQEPPIINNTVSPSLPEIKWLSYQNANLGITFDYPDKAILSQDWIDYSNIEKFISFNNILTKDNILYIKTRDCSFDAVEGEYQKGKQEYGKSFGLDPSWRITIKDIGSESELDAFIKQYYGTSCSYHKVATIFPDTFDIVLEGDGKSLDVTECPINYDYYLKYNPVSKKIASWNTSQECQLGLGFDKCFDKRIAESFHFIKSDDLKICPQEVAGFKFSYPKTWGDCKVDGQKISFRTDFEKYNVDLVADVQEISKERADQGFVAYNIKQDKISGINNSMIYDIACGGGGACNGININNQHFYEINWDVVSNQPALKSLDGVWRPDSSFTSDDTWNILRSISN